MDELERLLQVSGTCTLRASLKARKIASEASQEVNFIVAPDFGRASEALPREYLRRIFRGTPKADALEDLTWPYVNKTFVARMSIDADVKK